MKGFSRMLGILTWNRVIDSCASRVSWSFDNMDRMRPDDEVPISASMKMRLKEANPWEWYQRKMRESAQRHLVLL